MSEFYKMEPQVWDRNTDDLSLEQEAAYLRVCNAIYGSDQPIRENYRMLAGMFRCAERKAKRLLAELIAAGKLTVVDGWIINERAVEDVSVRRALRVQRQLAGHAGGIESGKSRAKSLKGNDTSEASASTRKEEEKKRKEEKDLLPSDSGKKKPEIIRHPTWRKGLSFGEEVARQRVYDWAKAEGERPAGIIAAASYAAALQREGILTAAEAAWIADHDRVTA